LQNCRLIVDPPAAGRQNRAIDECLLVDAAENGIASLRFYQWSEPTLSLGYFQRYDDRNSHPASRACAVVRRQTGGGAILHDCELTYSLVLPASRALARGSAQLYATVHEAIIAALTPRILAAHSHWCLTRLGQKSSPRPQHHEPFLCFQRRAQGDVLLTLKPGAPPPQPTTTSASPPSVKILGSAQRRHRGCILQHGSLLLKRSPWAPELAGWCDMTGIELSIGELVNDLAARLSQALHLEIPVKAPRLNSLALQSNAELLANSKYGMATWTKRR
jgi:lipoate-protein ligase A